MADSVGYVVGPPVGSALCGQLGRTAGLAVFAAVVAALLPALARVRDEAAAPPRRKRKGDPYKLTKL